MHAPDGFLNIGTSVVTGVISVGAFTLAFRQSRAELTDRQIPLAGVAAAFIFAGQMVNFPVAAGTSGHLLGGALAAILLGPALGALVVGLVIVVQALIFADGGLTALGYNTLNMAIVPAFGGYALFRMFRLLFPRSAAGIVGATALAAGLSVVLGAMAFSIEWLFGAAAPVPFDTVMGSMVSVHLVIGIGEAVISALTVSAVLTSRPDLVFGAADLDRGELIDRTPVTTRTFLLAGSVAILVLGLVVSQFASNEPDGLERVAADTGFADTATDHVLSGGLFADYATSGVGNESLSLALAAVTGVIVTFAVCFGAFRAVRPSRRRHRPMADVTT